ncbi:MAG: branched-chain-amino-acid transaminase [Desulfobacteraceae bacterium]
MLENRSVYLNGEFVPWDRATVHVMSHSFGRGSAVFEVLSCHSTTEGPAVFRLDRHVERLFRTMKLVGASLKLSREELSRAVLEAVSRNNIREGFIKVVGYYSNPAFEILPPKEPLDLAIFAVDPKEDLGGMGFPLEEGTTACVSKWRKLHPETVPVEAKAAANYLNGMMARVEARDKGYEHVIMLDTQGFVAEGGTESLFLVRDGVLMTPALGTVLRSITRLSVLEAAQREGIPAREVRVATEELYGAEELFFSGTPHKVLPVRQVDEHNLSPVPGPVSKRLSEVFIEILAGRDHRFKDWLFPVD